MRLDKRVDEEYALPSSFPVIIGQGGNPNTANPGFFDPQPVAPPVPEHPLVPYLDPFGIRRLPHKYNPFKRRFYDPLFNPFGIFDDDGVEGESQPMRLNKRMGY
tara:strand:- start:246 stop:557 length:312 start_codon:yes stop_codon:yes gene_type:complete